ncbi:MAG: MarR family winged helix-turn-helix transcriptional regulator [Proteobacteria bacterium]|nr:MarR family winged helix-turn-helix transcriptional regulator [Pseudomonadota bacterium]
MYSVINDRSIFYIARISDKANRLLIRELKKHGLQGLAPSHGDIMVALFKKQKVPMKELARIIDRDKSTVTGLVDKLVRLGYLEKQADPADQRVQIVSLTEKGGRLIPDFITISITLQERFGRGLDDEEKETLVRLLKKVNDAW